MKASVWMRLLCSVTAAALPLTLLSLSTGPDPGFTAAPGDSPLACASSGCHTSSFAGGPINPSFGGSVSATFSGGSTYTPGTPVNITVRVAEAGRSSFGFQMTARLESDPATQVGGRFVFQPGAGLIVLCPDGGNGTPRGNGTCPGVEYIEHSTVSSSGTWTFSWTPPATASGPVGFYIAGNAANGNRSQDGGDHIYTAKFVLKPASACVTSVPAIDHIISAGSFGARTDFAPGSWIEIYGSNFSTAASPVLWEGPDFNGINAPTSLDRVSVKVNGKDAYTWVVSPGQINAQAPDNDGTGPMNVTVTNCEQTSAPKTIVQARSAPGMWAPPSFVSNGNQLLGATTTDGQTFIGTIPGLNSRPARPGETLTAYGVGFGATNPPVAPGTITGVLNETAEPFSMTIGGMDATVSYKGLAPNFVGLYQFNFVVPNVPDGDQPVVVRLGTATLPETLFLPVRR